MFCFTYTRGQWAEGFALDAWGDHEDQGAWLKRIGFSAGALVIGNEHGALLRIFEAESGGSFLASIEPTGSAGYDVHLPDFPSMMMFLRDHASAFASVATAAAIEEMCQLQEKAFQDYRSLSRP